MYRIRTKGHAVENVFVIGLETDPSHTYSLRYFQSIRDAGRYRFHPLLSAEQVYGASHYPVAAMLKEAESALAAFPDRIDGLLTHRDFPSSTMAPILRESFGLPGPTLESVLRCEHKYWSRVEQRIVVPEHIPRFELVDPFEVESAHDIELRYPFWLKPVRSYASVLGFLIETDEDLRRALDRTREEIGRFAVPFNHLLEYADIPPEITDADGYHCVAEEIISSRDQCTLEGYVYDGEPIVYGVVDSIRSEGGSSFVRYQYPSRLPQRVQDRMVSAGHKIMRHVGYDCGPFNMEFFYNEENDRVWVLETNARFSGAHSPLFQMVEGTPHNEVGVELALGRRPDYPRGEGRFSCAAKFMLRRFEGGVVRAVPSSEEIERARAEFPELHLELRVRPGMVLEEMPEQDSYSFEYAVVYLGGRDNSELERKYERLLEILTFEFGASS